MRRVLVVVCLAACGGQIDPASVSSAQQAAPGDDGAASSSSSSGGPGCAGVRGMTTIATTMEGLAVDDTDVYVTESETGRVLRYPKCGGDAVEIYDGKTLKAPGAGVLKADGDYLYWSTQAYAGTIVRMPKTGGEPQPIVEHVYSLMDFAIDGDNVYWVDNAYPTTGVTSGNVSFVPKAGGQPTVLAKGELAPHSIAVAGDMVYWANSKFADAKGAIKRIPKAGGAQQTLVEDIGFIGGMAVSATQIAWIDVGFDASVPPRVLTIPIDGGVATEIVSDPNMGIGIVTDGDSFVWGTAADGNVELVKLAPDGTHGVVGMDPVPGGAVADGAFFLALDATRIWSLAWAYIDNPSGAPQTLLSNTAR